MTIKRQNTIAHAQKRCSFILFSHPFYFKQGRILAALIAIVDTLWQKADVAGVITPASPNKSNDVLNVNINL